MEQDERRTTEGIEAKDVQEAMELLGIFNPKPQIPLETTVTGHEIVAIAWRIKRLEDEVAYLKQHVKVPSAGTVNFAEGTNLS